MRDFISDRKSSKPAPANIDSRESNWFEVVTPWEEADAIGDFIFDRNNREPMVLQVIPVYVNINKRKRAAWLAFSHIELEGGGYELSTGRVYLPR